MADLINPYFEKLKETFYNDLIEVKSPTILEFGVRQGVSTKMFIEICESNMGKLYSLDIDDYSNNEHRRSLKLLYYAIRATILYFNKWGYIDKERRVLNEKVYDSIIKGKGV
jgi:predicted O-methyltransferase YrrM